MANAFDDIPDGTPAPLPTPTTKGANAFDDITPPAKLQIAKAPATASDRLQAAEGGFLKGAAYLATLPADFVANVGSLGTSLYDIGAHYLGGKDWADLPRPWHPNAVGGALTNVMDKLPITTTQPTRPDDAASRYLSAGASVIPGTLAGGGSVPSILRSTAIAAPGAVAGQYVAENKPFGKNEGLNNLASIAAQLTTTALMPRGRGEPIPENQPKNDAVTAGQSAGYEFPPATTNPTPGNRILESIAGKAATQQHASLNNQAVTNELARTDMGLPAAKGPITEADIAQAKILAAPGYDAIRSAGQITAPPTFARDLDAALSRQAGASRLAASLRDSKLENIIGELKQNKTFDASDAIDTIAELRDKASEAYRAGNSGVGGTYRRASNVIENAIEHSLSSKQQSVAGVPLPGSGSQLLDGYRASRQTFAKIATVEDSRNPTTGNVVAPKLVAALKRGDYLSGGLKVAADAAGQAPRAFAEPTHSAGVNHLGMWGSIGAAALAAHEYLPQHWGVAGAAGAAAIPTARYLARQLALGKLGQANALPRTSVPLSSGAALGAYTSLPRQVPAIP
jgi:hypothetical protein